jgi:hypothetical protein
MYEVDEEENEICQLINEPCVSDDSSNYAQENMIYLFSVVPVIIIL